jgi:two-component system, cell cycle sensor histidine kinase and response regulator CckA
MARVIIVDDNLENRYLLRAILQGHGYEVDEALQGAEALALARQAPPDLIISDLLMPVMDGYTLLREWKADEQLRTIPFIVYTATYTEPKDERLALDMGADAFMVKPAEPDQFMIAVRGVLEAAQSKDLPPVRVPHAEEKVLLKEYSEILIHKLEEKVVQLEQELVRRRQAEIRLAESETLFRNMFEEHAAAALIIDPDTGRIIDANHAAARFYGWSREQLRQMKIQDINTLTPEETLLEMEKARSDNRTQLEFRHRRADGSIRDVEVYSSNSAARGREVLYSIVHDITQRKQAQAALRESEALLRLAGRVARLGGWILNLADNRIVWSDEVAAILDMPCGCSPTLGDALNFFAPEWKERAEGVVGACAREGTAFDEEMQLITAQGRRIWGRAIGEAIRDQSGTITGLQGAFQDITEQKLAEAERERLMVAIEHSGEIIIITDPQGRIEYVNPVFETVTGYSRQEVLGQTPRLLRSGAQDEAFYQQMWQTISSGRTWDGRLVNKRKDGSLYTEAATISPVLNAAGKIVNYVAAKRDITENLRLMEQSQQAQKMEAVGQLAGGVAHDFNNILSVILGYTELALEECEATNPLRASLGEILKAGRRSRDIVRQLLAFARRQTIVPEVLDLNGTVEGMLRMLRCLIGENLALEWLPGARLWPVKMDPGQLDQILANLCINARDAVTNAGTISIETGNVVFDLEYCGQHAGSIPGDFVRLTVSDNGCGMDQATVSRIFEPFFTTKEPGHGTGLGLATVYGIVKQNNGFVNVYSELGSGTTFRIYLPRCADAGGRIPVETEAEIPRGQGETVLLVEDDASILRLASRMLTGLGYTVLTAETPGRAILIAEKQDGKIHLLITDVVMPGTNGRDLAARLREIRPAMKCLFMSGYTADVIAHRGVLSEGVQFLQKPFSIRDMATKVRRALN